MKTKPIISKVVKKIQDYLRESFDNYSLVFFTIFRNDKDSPFWNISGWKDCTKSPDTDLFDELVEFKTKSNVIYKNILSVAKKSQILSAIKKNNIHEVHLCGFDTDCCVLASAYDFFDLGIKPIILERFTWSTSKEKLYAPAIKMLKRNIGFVDKR